MLLGHSQGSRMLRALLRRVVDPDPALRDRLVAAIIPGANATEGETPGIPACTAPGDHGCVVSYSTFNEVAAGRQPLRAHGHRPGRARAGLPDGRALCTDPTVLVRHAGQLRTLANTTPFAPGVIQLLLLRLYGGPEPTADTPWLEPQDHYTARASPATAPTC